MVRLNAGPTAARVSAIISYFARHRTAANLLLLVMVVLGAISVPAMRAQFLPEVVINSITVKTEWEGASAEDVDEGTVEDDTAAGDSESADEQN